MKETFYFGSIINNTNKIISDSDVDWRGIREGSIVRFENDKIFYNVVKHDSFFYIKDFVTSDPKTISISDNVSAFLMGEDFITISFKEYEIMGIIKIIDGGNNYSEGDILIIDGGTPSIKLEDGILQTAKIRVAEVLPGGVISKVLIESRGKYIETPNKEIRLSGGIGNNAKIEVEYRLLESRAMIEREIESIQYGSNSNIKLVHPLPSGVKEGKISSKKQCLILDSNYLGKDRIGSKFDVARDFTINYGWPLLIPGSHTTIILSNQVFNSIDKKIKELEERVIELEKTVNKH